MHPWDTVPMGDSTEMGSKYKGDINSLIIPKQEPDTESPTTSSTFSIQHQLGYYEYLQKPIGFNPLTPPTPGYSTPTLPTFNATNLYEQEPTSTRYLESRVSPVIREATSSVPGLVSPNSVNCSGVLTPGHTPSPQPHNSPRSIGSLSPAPSTSSPRRAKTKKSDSTSSSSSGDDSNRGTIKKKTKSRVTKRRLPNGKNKAYKCKHCKMLFPIKADYWTHLVTHIRPERIISCPKCEFVTEFKHHFEYHIRNHDGVKPYKCSECNYTGTSKSMLESHLKHHSTIYQYRCQDCGYATKHLHSLKMHLKNFTHQPAVVLNPDGTENPDIIIDVYGRRRGPKNRNGRITKREMKPKKVSQKPSSSSPNVNRKKSISPPPTISSTRTIQPPTTQPQPVPELVNPSLPQGLLNLFQQHTHPYPALLPYLNLNLQMMAAQRQALMNLSPRDDTPRSTTVNHHSDDDNGRGVPEEPTRSNIPIDLTLPWQNGARQSSVKQINNKSPSPSPALSESESKLSSYQPISHQTPTGPKNNRRKGRAFKLQISDIEDNNSESAYELNKLNSMASSCSSNDSLTNDSDMKERDTSEQDTTEYGHVTGHTCKHCEITFKNEIMYTMHMGYHGFEDEFQCNSCGERTKDRVAFFMHIYKTKHN